MRLDIPIQQRLEMGRRSAEIARERFDPHFVCERFFRDMLALPALPYLASTNGTLS